MNIDKIISFIKNNNIKHYNITTLGIVLTFCGLINLLYDEFLLFLTLFVSGQLTNIIYKSYLEKYNNETQLTAYYNRLGEYLKLFITFFIFTTLYKKKINKLSVIIFFIITISYLLKYIIDLLIKNYDKKIKLYDFFTKYISNDKLIKINKILIFNNETYTIIYLLILTIYVNYKK